MAGIASKNLFDLLGDDGADASQAPAGKVEKKPAAAAGRPAPAKDTPARGGRGGGDNSYRERNQNRPRGGDEQRGASGAEFRGNRERGGRGRGRGGRGRGGRDGPPSDDRHSKTGVTDHPKQVGHGWGANTGDAEWADEKAGDKIAKADEDAGDAENTEAQEPVEEEPKVKSLDDYLAEQAEKRAQIAGGLEARKANEGANKKVPAGKELTKEEEEDFVAGSGGKKGRERSKKEKNVLELDGDAMRITDSGRERRGGGRGGPRGGRGGDFGGERRGRGDGARGRGDGGRGRGAPRGEGRGDGHGDQRGRGGRGGRGGNAPNVSDSNAFPSLGA